MRSCVLLVVTITLGVLIGGLLTGIVRPLWYDRLLERVGVFKTARPNDMVQAGIGRTFQNIRLFQNMTVLENVLVGMHVKLHSNLLDAVFSIASPEIARRQGCAVRCRELLAPGGPAGSR